jgi:predicted nucleic-acid-binding protein
MRAVDTNILVRAFTLDDPRQSRIAVRILESGDVFVPVSVVLETEWVLRSRYGFAADVVADTLEDLCGLRGVVVDREDAVRRAVVHLRQGIDFSDALHHALSEAADEFLSFDDRLVRQARRLKVTDPGVSKAV